MRGLRGRPRCVVLGGDALAAHAHVDPATGRLLTFSHRVRMTLRGPVTRLTVYEFGPVRAPCPLHGQAGWHGASASQTTRVRAQGCAHTTDTRSRTTMGLFKACT